MEKKYDFIVDDREDMAAMAEMICAMTDEEFEEYLQKLRREEWRNSLHFTPEQQELIKSLNIKVSSFERISEKELRRIEEKVGDCLQRHGFDENYEPNAVGLLCESIIDLVTSDSTPKEDSGESEWIVMFDDTVETLALPELSKEENEKIEQIIDKVLKSNK